MSDLPISSNSAWGYMSIGNKLDALRDLVLKQDKIIAELLRRSNLRRAECDELVPYGNLEQIADDLLKKKMEGK